MARTGDRWWLVVLSIALAASCAAPREARSAREPRGARADAFGEGLISFYGKWFDGKPTASGEKFDHRAMTAAHRTLPFGTCVLVRNLANGREVKVRVNDRGPYVGKRIIDVSEGAARELQMIDSGVVKARLSRCD